MNKLRWTKITAVAAAIIFNNWLLGLIFNHRLFFAGGSVSEFSAGGQPNAWIFRSLDIIAGLLFMAVSILIFQQRIQHRFWRWIAVGLFILGLANCADAILHLPCAGTLDPSCSAPIHVGLRRISLPDHAISSVVIGMMYLFLPIMSYGYAETENRRRLIWASLAAFLVTILFFILLFFDSVTGSTTIDKLAGFSEELQMLIFGWWLLELIPPPSRPKLKQSENPAT